VLLISSRRVELEITLQKNIKQASTETDRRFIEAALPTSKENFHTF